MAVPAKINKQAIHSKIILNNHSQTKRRTLSLPQ